MAPSPSSEKIKKAKETLCITEPTNSKRGVDVAYKFLSKKCHIDSRQREETEVNFKEIVNARDILKKAAEENVGGLKKIWKLAEEAAAKKRENYKKEKWEELVAESGPPPERHDSVSRTNTRPGSLLGSGTSELVPFRKKGNGSEKKSSHTNRHHKRHKSHTDRERGKKGSDRKEQGLAVVRYEKERPHNPDANEKKEKRKKDKEDEDRKERLKTIMKEYDKKVKRELEEHVKKQYVEKYASKVAKKEEVPTPSNRPKPQEQQNNSRSTSPDRQSTDDSSDTNESEESEDADELDIYSEEYARWSYDHYNNQQVAHPHINDASTSSQTGGYSRLPMNLTAEQTREFLGMGMSGYSRNLPLGNIKDGDTSGQVARR